MGLGMRPVLGYYTPPRWATNSSTTTEPTEAKKSTGAVPSEQPPAKEWNWLLNAHYEHIQRTNASFVFNWWEGEDLSDSDNVSWLIYHPVLKLWVAGSAGGNESRISYNGKNWESSQAANNQSTATTDKAGIDATRVIVCQDVNGGLMYSTNGSTWSTDTVTGLTSYTTALCTKYPDSDHIIVGSANGDIYIASGGITTSWAIATTPPPGATIINTICRLDTNKFICVDSSGATFVSTDSGDTWAVTTTSPSDVASFPTYTKIAVNAVDETVVAVGSNGGVNAIAAYSDDGGETWYNSAIISDTVATNIALGAVYYCGGKIWVACGDRIVGPSYNLYNIVVSEDNGETFRSAVTNSLIATGVNRNLTAIGCDGKQVVIAGIDWANVHSLAYYGSIEGTP